jgi:hypothetical protein
VLKKVYYYDNWCGGIGTTGPEDKLHVTSGATTGAAAITATPTLTLGTASGSYGAIKLYSGAQWSPVGKFSLIHVTNGNLHLDGADDTYSICLNWYGGSGGTHIGNGAGAYGALTKGSGTFDIPYPDPDKEKEGWRLRHSFVESPTRGDNLYRWQVNVKNGQAEIELPDYFRHLNENVQVWISPVRHFGRAYAETNEAMTKIYVKAEEDGSYNVLAVGTRKDKTAKENFDKLGVEYHKS